MAFDNDHSHETWDHPGQFRVQKPMPGRDFKSRAFTVGVGGPVGSGKNSADACAVSAAAR